MAPLGIVNNLLALMPQSHSEPSVSPASPPARAGQANPLRPPSDMPRTVPPRTLSPLYWPKRAAWMARVEVLNEAQRPAITVLRRLATAIDYAAVVLDGAKGGRVRLANLGAAMLLARRASGPTVIITECTWSRGSGFLDRAARNIGLGAIESPRVVYCVLSSDERRLFPVTWRVDPARVVFTPFYYTINEEDLAAPTSEDGGVFAGGDSLRDYEPLLRASRSLQAPVTVATRLLDGRRDLPVNVSAGRVAHTRFMELMRKASVVVVALARTSERSAGQQTYLNAMAFGKLVIVPDVIGVRDYISNGKTGLIVPPGDTEALAAALRWALDPSNRASVSEMAARAREDVRARFSPDLYVERILEVVDRFAQRKGVAGTSK